MKKFLPAIFISLIFTALMVSQMLINGQELSASRLENNKEKFTVYESQFTKFKTNTSNGNEIDLKKIKKPIVILNFWASWCRPCLTEFKSLNQLVEKFGEKVHVLGVNSDTEDAKKEVVKIEAKHKLLFESVLDERGKLASLFNVTAIPSSIVFHKGKVIGFFNREHDFMSEKFLEMIKSKIE
ncbi:MAG: thiol-disulfide isomerase/thioredoxin [Bacteriovoracaceae bacterium]|jgi:thiol-disulfide isomerase/thioredoxin